MMMRGKLYRFIFVESRFEPTFVAFFLIALFSGLQIAAVFALNGELREKKAQHALVARIPEMESILYPKAQRPTLTTPQAIQPVEIGGTVYILKGIQELNGKPAALINNGVYQEGDVIEDYRIGKITINSVLLKHLKTDQIKILRLSN